MGKRIDHILGLCCEDRRPKALVPFHVVPLNEELGDCVVLPGVASSSHLIGALHNGKPKQAGGDLTIGPGPWVVGGWEGDPARLRRDAWLC